MNRPPHRKERPCPRCGSPSRPDSFPFCSEQCRLADLSGWLDEAYTIPAEQTDDEDEEGKGSRPPV